MDQPQGYIQGKNNYVTLSSLPRQERIQTLYMYTPHSLSRVSLQCIDIGFNTNSEPNSIVDDIAEAILHFGQKALQGDQKALDTLGRFASHMVGSGRVRYKYLTAFATDKKYFDEQILIAYENSINQLYQKPSFIPYIKEVTSENILGTLHNNVYNKPHEHY